LTACSTACYSERLVPSIACGSPAPEWKWSGVCTRGHPPGGGIRAVGHWLRHTTRPDVVEPGLTIDGNEMTGYNRTGAVVNLKRTR
jgi:hypothetical protein